MTEAEKIICKMYLENYGKYKDCNEYKLLMGLLEQEPCEDKRLYIKIFADLEPDDIAKKIYQICDEDKFPKVIESLKEYFDSKPCDDLCKSCDTKGCIFQSGIKREKCDFYTPKKCGMSDEQIRTVNDMLTCDDAISRKAVDRLAWEYLKKGTDENVAFYEHFLDLPSVTPKQQTCEDAISRQAVLDGLASIAKAKAKSDAQKSLMGRVMFFTEHLPSVTPQQKMGKWIAVENEEMKTVGYYCSKCDLPMETEYRTKFCPNCGQRKMEVNKNEQNNKKH